jgi:hypothetical protein
MSEREIESRKHFRTHNKVQSGKLISPSGDGKRQLSEKGREQYDLAKSVSENDSGMIESRG